MLSIIHPFLHSYGTRSLTLNLGLRCNFHWAFIIAGVCEHIIGADFLHHFSILVDIKHHQLSDRLTQLTIQGIITSDTSVSLSLTPREPDNTHVALLRDFPSVTLPHISDCPVKRMVTYHILTTGPPISARPRRLAPE